uniref:Uncharacterized protein n=1 Tax=Pseudo-nitzschia australis TaxID=44445 RepID=A0A7S4EPI8_9STRA
MPTIIPLLTLERVSIATAVVVALAAVAICSFFTTAAATAGAGATLRSRRCNGGSGSLLFLCRCYSLLPLPCWMQTRRPVPPGPLLCAGRACSCIGAAAF